MPAPAPASAGLTNNDNEDDDEEIHIVLPCVNAGSDGGAAAPGSHVDGTIAKCVAVGDCVKGWLHRPAMYTKVLTQVLTRGKY